MKSINTFYTRIRLIDSIKATAFFIAAQVMHLPCFSQNVGIGITTPTAKLDIRHTSSTSNPTLNLYDNNAGNFSRLQFQNASGNKFWHISGFLNNTTDASSRLNFYHSVYGDVMSLTGDGKVGIGAVPGERLDVNGNLNVSGAIKLSNNAGLAGQVIMSNGDGSFSSWQSLPAGASVWAVSGNNIYNTNTGRVTIGTNAAAQGQLEISMNSGNDPQLLLNELENDYSRLAFKNNNGKSFTLAGNTGVGQGVDNFNIYSHKNSTDLLQVTTDPKNTVAVNGSLRLKKISFSADIGNGDFYPNNDINIGDASILELSYNIKTVCNNCGSGVITGIAGGVEGRVLYIFKRDQGYRANPWDNNYYAFRENDSRSLPQNRFAFQNIDLDNFDGITLIYLNGSWRCLGRYE